MIRFNMPVYIGTENKDRGLRVKCHDSGVILALHLMTASKSRWMQVDEDYRIPDGTTAVIRVKKPDNTVVLTDKGITFEGGSVVVCSELEQAYTAPGICNAELSLYTPEGKRLTTATFTYEVVSECVCDEDERSEDYMNVLGGIVKEVNAAATSAAESAAEAEEWAQKAAAGGGGGGSIIDSMTADKVTFADGETFQQKYDSGELTGPAGPAGKDGAPGADGKDGPAGPAGSDGKDGKDGAPGKDGETGPAGADGKDGKDGYTPVKGVDYFDGVDGKDGADGEDGITPHIGDNDNWWIGDTDTGIKAKGEDGKDGTGGSGGSSLDVYSTEETVVGTWIDGKPIYRATILTSVKAKGSGSATTYQPTILANVSTLNIDVLIDGKAILCCPSNATKYVAQNSIMTLYYVQNGNLGIMINYTGLEYDIDGVTLEYTKTTDTATVAIPSATALAEAYEEGVNET